MDRNHHQTISETATSASIPGQGQQIVPGAPAFTSEGLPIQPFRFDGGAGSYLVVGILAALLTLFTLGLGLPWAAAMFFRWESEHTIIYGRRLRFTGSGSALFGQYIKWFVLMVVTLGIYSFWVIPRMMQWKVENQEFGYAA